MSFIHDKTRMALFTDSLVTFNPKASAISDSNEDLVDFFTYSFNLIDSNYWFLIDIALLDYVN